MNRTMWGVIMVALGGMFLLQSLDIYHFGLAFWPVVWLLLGLHILLDHGLERRPRWFWLVVGAWVACIGLFGILHNAEITEIDGGRIAGLGWPVLLIAGGLAFLFRSGPVHISLNYRVEDGTVGDVVYGRTPWHLDQDLIVKHGVGDMKIDFTTADITDGVHHVQVKMGVGEMFIRVPDNVSVVVDAKMGIGDLYVLGDTRKGLGGLIVRKEILVPDAKAELRIKARLGVGQMRVVREPARIHLVSP